MLFSVVYGVQLYMALVYEILLNGVACVILVFRQVDGNQKSKEECMREQKHSFSFHTHIPTNLCALHLLHCPSSKLFHSELTVGSFKYFRLHF